MLSHGRHEEKVNMFVLEKGRKPIQGGYLQRQNKAPRSVFSCSGQPTCRLAGGQKRLTRRNVRENLIVTSKVNLQALANY